MGRKAGYGGRAGTNFIGGKSISKCVCFPGTMLKISVDFVVLQVGLDMEGPRLSWAKKQCIWG